jgi:hypothetical protein
MTEHVRVGGAWKSVASASVRVAGAWKPVVGSWTKVAGVWKQSFVPFNDATGGTITTYTVGAETWRRHTFLTSGTLTVVTAAVAFKVTVVGSGGGGGAPADGFGASPGTRGGFHSADTALTVGAHPVTIGAAGASGGPVQIGGSSGTRGGNGGNTVVSGAWTAGGGAGGGAGPSAAPGTNGTGDPTPAADGGVTVIDYASHGLASTIGTGGTQAVGPYPGTPATAGLTGAAVIEYRIA